MNPKKLLPLLLAPLAVAFLASPAEAAGPAPSAASIYCVGVDGVSVGGMPVLPAVGVCVPGP